MDEEVIKRKLGQLIASYRTTFEKMVYRQSQLLELSALMLTAEHYKSKSYSVLAKNLIQNKFKVKTNARGYPRNFSFFECRKNNIVFEIHANLPVESYYKKDKGRYVVDVGVINSNLVLNNRIDFVENDQLFTFVEAKKIVIYPMLLAQFIGIVHEIKPKFLGSRRPYNFKKSGHFDPALVAIGYLHATSIQIREGFKERHYKVNIIPVFDIEVSRLNMSDEYESPLK